jgi:predicted ATP-grasp superfamily ATP-dependent carboligase
MSIEGGPALGPLIVLGASARAAAASAARAGYEPYTIDLFADADLAALCPCVRIARYPHDFAAALAAAPAALWLYTGGLENYPRLVDRLARVRPLAGNCGPVLRRVRDLRQLAALTREAGLSFPAVRDLGGNARAADSTERWLIKPRRGSGGMLVRWAQAGEGASRRAYLQEYVAGQAASALFVAAAGRAALVGTSRQLLGRDFGDARPFLYAGSIAPLAVDEAALAALRRLGSLLAERFGLVGLFNVDLVERGGRLWVLEVNPRYSASAEVIERASGQSLLARHMAACVRGALPEEDAAPAVGTQEVAGKAVVYAPARAVIDKRLAELVRAWNGGPGPPQIADLPHAGSTIAAGEPVVTVYANGESLAAVEAALRARVEAVREALGIAD